MYSFTFKKPVLIFDVDGVISIELNIDRTTQVLDKCLLRLTLKMTIVLKYV